jgi:large subunit ribosomal protein L9
MSKVILKENIRNLGRVGDVVLVRDGYAFNFLIPRGKALPATLDNLESLATQKQKMLEEDKQHRIFAEKIATQIPPHILLAREVNENGVLYGSVSVKDVADALPNIQDKHAIHLKNHHINTYGVYDIQIELHHDVVLNIKLSISDTIENANQQLNPKSKTNNKEETLQSNA